MNYLYHILLVVLLWCGSVPVLGQPHCDIQTYSIQNGLPSQTISGLSQSPDHLLWVSTWNGLSCFDGYSFHTFHSGDGEERLVSQRILSVHPNSQRDVWTIAYGHRLYLFDTHQCRYIDYSTLLPGRQGDFVARTVYTLPNGHSWLVSYDGGPSYCVVDSLARAGKGGAVRYAVEDGNLPDNVIRKVMLDGQGRQWVITNKGSVVVGSKLRTPRVYEHLIDMPRQTLLATADGAIVAYGPGATAARPVYTAAALASLTALERVDDRQWVAALWQDSPASVGMAMHADRSMLLVGHDASTRLLPLGDERIHAVRVDSRHRVWVFTDQRLRCFDGKSWQELPVGQPMVWPLQGTRCSVPFFFEDANHTVWVVAPHGVFSYYDEATRQLVPYALQSLEEGAVDVPTINKFFFDKQQNLWFTSTRDLVRVHFSKHPYTQHTLIAHQEGRALAEHADGSLWVGMYTGELALVAPDGRWRRFLRADGRWSDSSVAFSSRIYALREDSRGRLWIGTKGDGLYLRQPDGRIRHFTAAACHFPAREVYDFWEDSRGQMWIATYDAGLWLASADADEVKRAPGYPTQSQQSVRRITPLGRDTLLVATNDGVVVMRPSATGYRAQVHRQDIRQADGLLANDVLQVVVTRRGRIFIVTLGGGLQELPARQLFAARWQLTTPAAMDQQAGGLQSAVEDGEGRLWLVREKSLDCYHLASDSIEHFEGQLWGSTVKFSEARPLLIRQGREVCLATVGGCLTFAPRALRKSSYRPAISFVGVRYQGEPTIRPVLNADELYVSADRRSLTLFFSALDYRDSRQLRYAYRLDGHDDDWTYVGQEHSASFNRLPPGHLRLLVRSTNSDGVWQDNVTVLRIYSHPTFWETGWAKLLYAAIFCALMALAIYIYTLRARFRRLVTRLSAHLRAMRQRRRLLDAPTVADPDEVMMTRLKAYLEAHIADSDLTVDQLCRSVNMSRSAFQQRVKALTGLTPVDFIRHVRLERGAYMLLHSQEIVTQIAYSVGFADAKYFSKCFKKAYGMTPSAYRAGKQQTDENE